MDFISQTWHWSISGFLIGMIMLTLLYFGKTFGMSSNLRTMCTILGTRKYSNYFDFNWKEQKWNLVVVLGAICGGFIAFHFLHGSDNFQVNPTTLESLKSINIDLPNGKIAPDSIFSLDALLSIKGFLILLFGGVLVGFGTRYAGGCTSGHAITGLSNFQLPSLIAVIGFFIGGLIMTYFILPNLF